MTTDELAVALPAYTAGIEAELALLGNLRRLAEQQRDASESRNLAEVNRAGDERERIMAALARLEHELKPIRLEIAAMQNEAKKLDGFEAISALHRTAASLVVEILQADENTLAQLKLAELTRRTIAQSVENGEPTLAAYRRVLTPALGSGGLIDRRG